MTPHIALPKTSRISTLAIGLGLVCLIAFTPPVLALGQERIVDFQTQAGAFALADSGEAAPLLLDPQDYPGVTRAAHDLQSDLSKVTGSRPVFLSMEKPAAQEAVVIGTIGKSRLIDGLVRSGKLDTSGVAGKWESFVIQVVSNPMPGVSRGLVIAGSDKRGTIYGIYELSEQIGVSPWYWWADVPVVRRDALFVRPGRFVQGEPAVKYRGIFLNDEAPALTGWVKEKFGDYNSKFYTKVFELLLRLRANYLWPAMWNSAFNEDDPLNPQLADEYGIVMGTSHHEPMLRAQQEWKRHGRGPWNYTTNAEVLRQFWAEGVKRNRNYESIITIGMRGDGDLPMSEEDNVALLQKIVADQRKIIAENVNPDVTAVPQLWALYKEVQGYFEKGMRVPDDVTLLWCDDNWGNIRRLPTREERNRPGGAGIYYHFDYVGGPRSYKWLNTVPIRKVWEQMHLAHEYGANRIWIVNVGDLKPMEFPIEFFLTYARDPERWPHTSLVEYGRLWAAREFGEDQANEIADIVAGYTKLNGRRKPELLAPDTYSLVNYQEAERVVGEWNDLQKRAEQIEKRLPADARDAFYQLVLHPVKASALVNRLHVTIGNNRLYAVQGRASTNDLESLARQLFREDAEVSRYYNEALAGGKWDHMMDQTHIGYTYWQQPVRNALPGVQELQLPNRAELGVSVEGSTAAWPSDDPNLAAPALPTSSMYDRLRRYFEVFNRGLAPLTVSIKAKEPWIGFSSSDERDVAPTLTVSLGPSHSGDRIAVNVDWATAPAGASQATVEIEGTDGRKVVIAAPVLNPGRLDVRETTGFVETNGCVSIEAEHFSRAVNSAVVHWEHLADLGRTLGSMTIFPVTVDRQPLTADSARLEYDVVLSKAGEVTVECLLGPTLNFLPGEGLTYAISFDDETPQIVKIHEDRSNAAWERSVADAVRKLSTTHRLDRPGRHTLKFWAIDPAALLQKIVIDTGGVRPSYLGPPESPSMAVFSTKKE